MKKALSSEELKQAMDSSELDKIEKKYTSQLLTLWLKLLTISSIPVNLVINTVNNTYQTLR